MDIIIILDSSGSVGVDIWPQEVEFAIDLVNRFKISKDEVHVGVIDFSNEAIVRVDMNKPEGQSKSEIKQVLEKLKDDFQGGVTYTDLALKAAVRMYHSSPPKREAEKLLIVVTDGKATRRDGKTGAELMMDPMNEVKNMAVQRIAIGVGQRVVTSELEAIASHKNRVLKVDDFAVLLRQINRTFDALCPSKLCIIAIEFLLKCFC